MASSDRPDSSADDGSIVVEVPDWLLTPTALVAAVALLALVARLVLLGDRVAHWDEGRVGYWIVYYQETGHFAYRRIIHGPFIQHVNRWLFPVVGANDFTMRLPVAVVGALLPASVLLFREHLRKSELVAAALFLAFNPVLLYYSRFMRSDVLVAAFMFVSFGLLVRLYDTREVRYLLGAAAFAAFGFASKENAIVYVATWVGATALLADQALYRPREHDSGLGLLLAKGRGLIDRAAAWADALSATRAARQSEESEAEELANGGSPRGDLLAVLHPLLYPASLLAAALVFFALSLFFYAPRGAGVAGIQYPPADPAATVGFWEGFSGPGKFATMVGDTVDYVGEEFGTWITQAGESGDESLLSVYTEYLGRYVRVMGTKAPLLTGLGVIGFVAERYGAGRSRNLVMFAAYCGLVSVVGYPLGTDIFGAWIVVHALVPLAIPAGVALAWVYRWGRELQVDHDDDVGLVIAAAFVILCGGIVASIAVPSVYVNDQSDDNHLVQYAQPAGDPRAELNAIATAARDDENGTDVLVYYGEQGSSYQDGVAFVEQDESGFDQASMSYHPLCMRWFNALPLPWYFAKDDANVTCERQQADLADRVQSDPPPVIITQEADSTVPTDLLAESYRGETYELRTYGTETTFWVREGFLDRS